MNVFSLKNSCTAKKPVKVITPGDNEKFTDRYEYPGSKRFNPAAGIYIYFLLTVLLLFPYSCDNIQDSPIPYVPVSLFINLNIVNELTVSGNSVMFSNYGFGGIIVYCEYPGSYYAYDAGCTKDLRRDCSVVNDGALAECPCCGSLFVLMNSGYPSKGPAEMPLKQYHVTLVNNYELRVYN